MLSIGSLSFFPKTSPKPSKTHKPLKLKTPICNLYVKSSMEVPAPDTESSATNFGFMNLMQTFKVEVQRAENRRLNVPLIAPFTIASSRLDKVENVAVRIELKNECVGWGEIPILPFVTAEDQPIAMAKAKDACEMLKSCSSMTLEAVLGKIGDVLPGHQFASVRAGVEMALIDAVAKSIGIPLWRLFGGASNTIITDITIPIVSPAEAAALALNYRKQGFKTLKLKVGKNLKSDIEVLQAIRAAHPDCSFILDANEGYTPEEAIEVLKQLHEMGVTPILFEQPVHRDDWDGLSRVTYFAKNTYGISVAADESCRSLDDVKKIVRGELADVVNIKLAKVGVIGALEIIEVVRTSGLDLMIGGMVETRMAMGFAGHLAAGLGCFKFVDLDTPLLLSEDPVLEGYEETEPRELAPLSLDERVRVAIDVARCLNYLHNERAIPHGNLKSTNILLETPNLTARLTDYSLHRILTPAGTAEQVLNAGALGYRPPEFASSSKPCPSLKSDVYAFGVILMELLTGKSSGEIVSGSTGMVDLTDWVRLLAAEDRAAECFDQLILERDNAEPANKMLDSMLRVALKCILPAQERPDMKSVYEDLSVLVL